MANHLKMAQVQAIQVLRAQGCSFRQIARQLGIHRETVARYARMVEAAGPTRGDGVPESGQTRPNLPTGSDGQRGLNPSPGPDDQNRPNPPTGYSGPASRCEPLRAVIIEGLERGLSAQRIWQDLRTEHGFDGGYDSVTARAGRLGAQGRDAA